MPVAFVVGRVVLHFGDTHLMCNYGHVGQQINGKCELFALRDSAVTRYMSRDVLEKKSRKILSSCCASTKIKFFLKYICSI